MRKLAKIVKIDKLEKHNNADTLDVCYVGGWTVVAKSGLHQQGNLVVYCEIDSWMPHTLAPFLTKEGKEPREFEGIKGQLLKTARLRGVLSQGLIIPLCDTNLDASLVVEGNDVSEALGIIKYEPPVPSTLNGQMRCAFPGCVPKTDSERIQNLDEQLQDWKSRGLEFEVTEKLEGTSCTFIKVDNDIHVCSRNWSLYEDESTAFWKMYHKYNIKSVLDSISHNCAIQGEIVGPNIQENIYKLNEPKFYVFNIYNIDEKRYLSSGEMTAICLCNNLLKVPVDRVYKFTQDTSIEALLGYADGPSYLRNETKREGFVYKNILNPTLNFKTVSNEYLLTKK